MKRRPLLAAIVASATALTMSVTVPMSAGAAVRHHHRHHRLSHVGLSKPIAPTVTISALSPDPLLDNFGPLDVTVTRTGSTKKALNLTLNAADATAVGGTDYQAGPYAVTIPKGQTATDVFIPITDDETADANEEFSVSLSNAPHGTVIVPGLTTATIVNDDQSGSFTVHDGDTITLSNIDLIGCDVLQESLVNLFDHSVLTGPSSGSGGCNTTTDFSDRWTNKTGADVSVGVQLIDTTGCSAFTTTYESDDQQNLGDGNGWLAGDHTAVWTLPSGTYIAMTDNGGCGNAATRDIGPADPGNLQATVSIATP